MPAIVATKTRNWPAATLDSEVAAIRISRFVEASDVKITARISVAFLALLGAVAGNTTGQDIAKEPVVWQVDQLERIGGHQATIVGAPRVVETEGEKAVQFDGKGDAIFLDVNPLAGLKQFTV
jgi:hypothetical protein